MRTHTNKCLLVVAMLVVMPSISQAQISRFFKRSSTATRQTHIPTNQATVPNSNMPGQVRQVQLEELIPAPVVPSPLTEASIPGLDAAPAMDFNTGTIPPPAELVDSPPMMQSYGANVQTYGEQIPFSESTMNLGESPVGETIIDSGYGQPYDIPLNDVIPQQSAETYSTGDWFRNGNWYSRQEFMMLLRADLPHVHVALDTTTNAVSNGAPIRDPNFTNSLSTKDTDFSFEAGTRLTIGHRLGRDPANRDHSLEFSFLGLFDYTGRASISPDNVAGSGIFSLVGSSESAFSILTQTSLGFASVGFVSLNPINGLNLNSQADILHQANFNSMELNYVLGARPAKDRLVMQSDGRWVRHATPSKVRGLFGGLRYIRQNEHFQYRGVGEIQGDGTVDLDVGGMYSVKTDNDLIGVQFGGEFVQKRTDWIFGLKGKFGGLVNFADRGAILSQTTASTITGSRVVSTNVQNDNERDETLAFLGEGGVFVAYYIRPNTALRVGYDVIYLNGMATATNNLGIRGDEFAAMEVTGDSLYHGMNFGFEMTW